jgi:starch phosphorylase
MPHHLDPRLSDALLTPVRTAPDAASLTAAILDHLRFSQGRVPAKATLNDWYMAVALTVRDRMMHRVLRTVDTLEGEGHRAVCYLSAEFLVGPHLENNLVNLGIADAMREATAALGLDLGAILAQEEEPGLGNGGLGRLAACFLDSLSTLEIPAIGYGIRYEFGIFDQEIRDGWQVEVGDRWLARGNPWEIPRPASAVRVKFGGRTETYTNGLDRPRVRWLPAYEVQGEPYDTPIVGYRTNTANLLRLWSAGAVESFDFTAFDQGDYLGAVEDKIRSENISKVLYPNDNSSAGRRLRLEQQYFFVSCSLQDVIRRYLQAGGRIEKLARWVAIQMNDTHPSVAVAELMRLLVDEHDLAWDLAWDITRQALGYTNHTLLPEALERWPLALFGSVLPRHLEIVFEINRRFLDEVRARFPGDEGKVARLSLIDESGERYVRMANLASAGSHAINGVAGLHTALLKRDVLADFHELYPERFHSITNGVTPRRWVAVSNPALTALVTEHIGEGWLTDLRRLRALEPLAEDAAFRARWRAVKRANKARLADHVRTLTGTALGPDALFDVQVKRIHEYKRQHLNALHVIARYLELKRQPARHAVPRVVIVGGKAAPGYRLAKLMIRLVNGAAEVINADPAMHGRLSVVFLPNFTVGLGHLVYPAADLSEQISTAGKEASGTGNMKFIMNGAVTIGTADGANIEIREQVGEDPFFLFGLSAEEAARHHAAGYDPRREYASQPALRAAIDAVASGMFSRGDPAVFRPLLDGLLHGDPFLVLADFASYAAAQARADEAYADPERWTRLSILNTARSGWFSSDRSIAEYAEHIWNVSPVKVDL